MPRAFRPFAVVLLLLPLLAGCDDAPGPPTLIGNPPTLSDFQLTPLEFVLTGGQTADIPLTFSVAVQNPGGGAVTVRYVVRAQFGNEALAEGDLTPSGGRYTGNATLSLPRGETGLYVVTVAVLGEDGLGNEATALLNFVNGDPQPPVIASVEFPPTVTPPAEFSVVATVSDPDGLSNIARVTLNPGNFDLLDDGGIGSISGDATADDGRFTVTFQVPDGQPPGPETFTIQAFDRDGLASAPVEITIDIQ